MMNGLGVRFGLALALLCVSSNVMLAQNADSSKPSDEKLVIATFQKLENGRLVSSRSGPDSAKPLGTKTWRCAENAGPRKC